MTKATIGWSDTVDGTCGVGVFGGFEKYTNNDSWYKPCEDDFPEGVDCQGGAGWQIAGFIPNSECREIYLGLKKRFKIVFQSEVRVNTNSGNKFFFCVYDVKAEQKANNTRRWPFPKEVL